MLKTVQTSNRQCNAVHSSTHAVHTYRQLVCPALPERCGDTDSPIRLPKGHRRPTPAYRNHGTRSPIALSGLRWHQTGLVSTVLHSQYKDYRHCPLFLCSPETWSDPLPHGQELSISREHCCAGQPRQVHPRWPRSCAETIWLRRGVGEKEKTAKKHGNNFGMLLCNRLQN